VPPRSTPVPLGQASSLLATMRFRRTSPASDVERAGCFPGGVVVRQEPAIPRSSVLLGDGRGRTSGGAAWGNHLAKSPTLKLGLPFSTLLTGTAFLVVYLAWKATNRHVQHRQFGD
jgi:hypothetical protein